MYTLNHIVQKSGISRHLILKYTHTLGLHPLVEQIGRKCVYYYSPTDVKILTDYAFEQSTESKLRRQLHDAETEIAELKGEKDRLRSELKQALSDLNEALFLVKQASYSNVENSSEQAVIEYEPVKRRNCDRSGYKAGAALLRSKIGNVN